jgi:hypothetical protein
MAELPLLFFPQASVEAPARRGGAGSGLIRPSAEVQKARHDRKFRDIADSFKDLQSSIEGMEPEQVIVLETIGEAVEGLAKAAAQVPGLEWLTEIELEDSDPCDGFQLKEEKKAGKPLTRRLYALMSNQKGMNQLLSLWAAWCEHPDEEARRNFGPFKNVFIHLKDVRRWGVQDRLAETRAVEYWQEELRYRRGMIRFEVELWCRADSARRAAAYEKLRQLIAAAGGRCISQAVVPEILYFGVLAELPAPKIKETLEVIMDETYSQILRCEEVMFFRPHAQSAFRAPKPSETQECAPRGAREKPDLEDEPVIALLDGLPLEHHHALDGRLIIDDEDDHSSRYTSPEQQQHGTAMASLIAHGDLSAAGEPLPRRIYLRPIFVPYQDDGPDRTVWEKTPDDQLLVDLVHRAVLRIKGIEGEDGAAPTVKVVNLSIGNPWQPFCRQLSPLARLLDWLSWKYKILFVVSAGNQSQNIKPAFTTTDISRAADDEVITKTLEALLDDQVHRRPFSPAEAINVLTVGALHADESTSPAGDRRVDLLRGAKLPSPLSTVSAGFNRCVIPDVLFPGGRQFYTQRLSTSAPPEFSVVWSMKAPGLFVASPGVRPGELNRTAFSRGTSNATALATRTAGRAYERLLKLVEEPGGDRLTDEYIPVILKALLAHGASWGEAGETLERIFRSTCTDWRDMLRLKTRLLGHGAVDPERALFSTDQRVVMLGWDALGNNQAHSYHVPLPPSLRAQRIKRRLTVTLAWFSPTNPWHKDYRKASLWFSPDKDPLALDNADLDAETSRRGTLQHQVFEGHKARAFDDEGVLTIKVSCAEDAGKLKEVLVPYALAVTLEIAEPTTLEIFNEIKSRIRLRVKIDPKAS